MKRDPLLVLFLLCLSAKSLQAQTFVGTMTVGNYIKNDVTVQVQPSSSQDLVSITLFGVKFAKLMPVKLDVKIDSVLKKDNLLTGDNIVPTNKGKQYEKYLVRHLEGVIERDGLRFTCQMGRKQLDYKEMKK